MELQPIPMCDGCGQQAAFEPSDAFPARLVCEHCHAIQREPQGEAVRLFTPAPAQMPGQMTMRRAGQFSCSACGTDEAMPGHEC